MNVKGLKITDIMNIDLDTFNRLNESELRALTSRLVSAGNKRIRRLENKNINSPALYGLGKEKTFSTKLSSEVSKQQRINKLRSEFARARSFLSSETSTITGWKRHINKMKKRLADELGLTYKQVSEQLDIGKMYDLLHKAQESGLVSSYRGSKGSEQARNIIAEILIDKPDASEEDIMTWLQEQSDELYEDQEELEEFEDDTEEFEL